MSYRSDTWWTQWRAAGVVSMGAGVIGLVAGGVLGLVATGRYDDARGRCSDGATGCPASAVVDSDSAYRLATGATVVFVIGAAVVAGGAAMVLFGPADGGKPAPAAKSARASASVHVGPGSVGVVGRW
jgi:hypothetical protein